MTDLERIETEREFYAGISPLVTILCDVCLEEDCECSCQGECYE